ncbi:hypothetical protein Tco_1340712, partial [Tanacetum coccineum]
TVNGKNAYELKGKFLDDLLNNAFSGTNEEDAIEDIDYFLKIVDPIKLLNVNYERIRLAIFPISLVGNASEWFDEFKAIRDPSNSTFEKWLDSKFANYMIMDPFTKKVAWDFWIKNNDHEEVANEGFFDDEEGNNDDEGETAKIFRIETNLFDYERPLCTEFKEFNFLLKVDLELFTRDIERTKTYEHYENKLNDELEEPWFEDGVPYEICDPICEPFRFKSGKAKFPTCNSNEDGFCNRGELLGMVQGDASQSVLNFFAWLKRSFGKFQELDYELLVKLQDYCNFMDNEEHEDKDKHGLFDNQKRLVCNIRIFEMIKYSFSEDEEYVAIKECEYDDLTKTNEDSCRTYQEIFRRMDKGWMVTRTE